MAMETGPFGLALCEELKAAGRLDVLTRRFDYAALQKLRAADREATVKLFQGSPYEVLQALKALAPAEVARYLIQTHDGATAAGGFFNFNGF